MRWWWAWTGKWWGEHLRRAPLAPLKRPEKIVVISPAPSPFPSACRLPAPASLHQLPRVPSARDWRSQTCSICRGMNGWISFFEFKKVDKVNMTYFPDGSSTSTLSVDQQPCNDKIHEGLSCTGLVSKCRNKDGNTGRAFTTSRRFPGQVRTQRQVGG